MLAHGRSSGAGGSYDKRMWITAQIMLRMKDSLFQPGLSLGRCVIIATRQGVWKMMDRLSEAKFGGSRRYK